MIDLDFLIDAFKWFHQHPEKSFEEHQTQNHIATILKQQGIDHTKIANTGILVEINADHPHYPCIGIRADIDALPIQENSGVSYASLHDGMMHACGHDAHITIGIGLAIRLNELADRFTHRFKIVFQPGEESSLGVVKIMDSHVMDDCTIVLGFHADPTNPIHTLGLSHGAVAAAVDHFIIDIEGVGCHGAHPDSGIDPIVAATAIAQGLNTIVSRNMDPFHATLVSTTRISAGNTWNVVPSSAQLEGTFRTLDGNDRVRIAKRIKELANGIASGYQCQSKVEIIAGPPAVVNDATLVDICRNVAQTIGYRVVEAERSMGGDDFSFYLNHAKGIYIKFGTGIGPSIHHDDFKVDPACILPFVEYMIQCIIALDQ